MEKKECYSFRKACSPYFSHCSLAGSLLQEFLAVQDDDETSSRLVVLHQRRPPDPGIHKVNFDMAIFGATNSSGIGVIIRDWRGQAVGALSVAVSLANSVLDMEAVASRRVVNFAAELDLHRVIFEGDSAIVINAVSQGNAVLASYGNIVEDIRCLASSFLSFDFIHVHQNGNLVADSSAKKAKNIVGCQVWSETMPEDIVPLVTFDVH